MKRHLSNNLGVNKFQTKKTSPEKEMERKSSKLNVSVSSIISKNKAQIKKRPSTSRGHESSA